MSWIDIGAILNPFEPWTTQYVSTELAEEKDMFKRYEVDEIVTPESIAGDGVIPTPGTVLLDDKGRARVTADPIDNEFYVFTDKDGYYDVKEFRVIFAPPEEPSDEEILAYDLWKIRNEVAGRYGYPEIAWEEGFQVYRDVYLALARHVLGKDPK